MSADHEPGSTPDPKKPRRSLPGRPSHDRSEIFGVLDNALDPDPRLDEWPELGEPPVVIEPYGIRVSRVDTSGLGGAWWPADRPHSRQWVFDASEVNPGVGVVSFDELERLVPEATRAARAARAAAGHPGGAPTGSG
ncbi:MAG: hypothetical protein K2X82_28885 [Gemmataceae bacterium]|nr:hypothetical protein [Gemmataceae bacterium]